MVVAILGVITALALPFLVGVFARKAVGTVVAIPSREGVVDVLTRPQGVAGIGIFENVTFSVKLTLAEQNEVRNSPFLVGRTLAGW